MTQCLFNRCVNRTTDDRELATREGWRWLEAPVVWMSPYDPAPVKGGLAELPLCPAHAELVEGGRRVQVGWSMKREGRS